jgi:AbrB family looped-hinge helix DNA binding protein
VKVSAKGQVTIPAAYRKMFGLTPGMHVEFDVSDDTLKLRKQKRKETSVNLSEQWLTRAAGSAKPGFRTDEVMVFSRGED